MKSILKHLEYLIPLLAGMPNIVKLLFGIWLVFTLALFCAIATISYQRNKEKATQEKDYRFEVTKTQINRLIEDFDLASKKTVKEFPKEVDRINGNFNARYAFDSGMRLTKLWETANQYKARIDGEYRTLTRKMEDIILQYSKQKDINEIPELRVEAQRIQELRDHYEREKKHFEGPARKADLRLNKNNPVITEEFETK